MRGSEAETRIFDMARIRPLICYVRVSRKGDREDDRFHSPREQAERARSHAGSKGLAVGEVVEDIDVSGATQPRERPGMSYALEAIKSGKAGGLVAFSLDRVSRDPNHGDWLVREVTQAGGVITTADMPEDITSPTGEFTFGMLLAVARVYRRTAGARFQSAKERATRAGIAAGSVPLGYRKRPDRTLEPDPETAPLVVSLFEARAAGGSWTTLAQMLADGTGRTWPQGTLRSAPRREGARQDGRHLLRGASNEECAELRRLLSKMIQGRRHRRRASGRAGKRLDIGQERPSEGPFPLAAPRLSASEEPQCKART